MFDRYDALDDARDRDDREGLDRHRSGRGPGEKRERSLDPRDVFMRDLDMPRDRERQEISLRDRTYELRGSESRTLATVGAFRVVSSSDLRDHDGKPLDPRRGDLRHLREAGLVETARLGGRRDHVVTLTKEGRDLLHEYRRSTGERARQAFYAGVRKPRELAHDVQVYRAYERAAERITERDGRIRRAVLDYELCSPVHAVAPTLDCAERSVVSRLRSLRSPLRGLDTTCALPSARPLSERRHGPPSLSEVCRRLSWNWLHPARYGFGSDGSFDWSRRRTATILPAGKNQLSERAASWPSGS